MLDQVLADIRVPRVGVGCPRTCPDVILADRAYATGPVRRHLRTCRITAVIPEKQVWAAARTRTGSAGGRPPAFDVATYKRRNVVERPFALTKQRRGLATRYNTPAITYRATVVLSACIAWTRL